METRSSHPRETARSLELSHLAAHAVASPSVPRLASSIRALRSTLQRVVGKSVRLSLDIEHGVGDAQVDRDELARVLVDLATNARDAMGGEGHLTIAMRDITALDAAYVGVFVADDGAGISPDVVCRLFKGPVTTKQANGGRGLGLIHAHRFVRAARGCLQIESFEGVGTTISMMFPRIGGREASTWIKARTPRGTRCRRSRA